MAEKSGWLRIGGLVGLLIGAIGLALVIYRLVDGWPEVSEVLSQGRPHLAVAAVGAGLLAMSTIGLGWWVLLRRLGAKIHVHEALFQYFVGQLGKYLPGGVWPVIGRAEMARRGGTDGSTAYASTLLSLANTYLAALMSAALFLAVSGGVGNELPWAQWVLLAVPIGLLLLHPRALGSGFQVARRVTRNNSVIPIPRWSTSLVLALLHIPAWLAISGATYLAMLAVGGEALFPQVAFATCMSWFLGFVIVGLPGGLGVREAAFIAMVGTLDPAVAAAVALVARMVFVVVDLLGAGVSSASIRLRQRNTDI